MIIALIMGAAAYDGYRYFRKKRNTPAEAAGKVGGIGAASLVAGLALGAVIRGGRSDENIAA
jgi:cytochrome bd-type quinol oxidase subunit 2